MNLQRVFTNGLIIFLGIGIYFLIMDFMGLTHIFFLRVLNLAFVAYGVNRTIQQNYEAGVRGFNTNILAAIVTSMIGALLSIASLLVYIHFNGGEEYLKTLQEGFLFGGGNLSIYQYCFGLLFEAVAASMIVSYSLMLYWKGKVENINKVD